MQQASHRVIQFGTNSLLPCMFVSLPVEPARFCQALECDWFPEQEQSILNYLKAITFLTDFFFFLDVT